MVKLLVRNTTCSLEIFLCTNTSVECSNNRLYTYCTALFCTHSFRSSCMFPRTVIFTPYFLQAKPSELDATLCWPLKAQRRAGVTATRRAACLRPVSEIRLSSKFIAISTRTAYGTLTPLLNGLSVYCTVECQYNEPPFNEFSPKLLYNERIILSPDFSTPIDPNSDTRKP